MTEIELSPLTRAELQITRPWFEDEETRRWLGDERWPKAALRLAHEPKTRWYEVPSPGRFAWLARLEGTPVGLIDVELYADATAGLALVVDPALRGRRLGAKLLQSVVLRTELADTERLRAGIEPENRASVRCFEEAGFSPETLEPDEEGFVYFAKRLR